MTPAVSVIVPVYNAEPYIRRCLDSISAQTFKDFEVILIDDGSPDHCGAICDEYARQDSRFRVIHKENEGVAVARQCGIDNAQGTYSIHCDPDDWVEPNWLEELYTVACRNNADMAFCDFYYENPKSQTIWHYKYKEFDALILLHHLLDGGFYGSCWNKLTRTALYKTYGISFEPKLSYCEDLLVVASLLIHDIAVDYITLPLYHYNKTNENSLTSRINKRKVDNLITVVKKLDTLLPPTFSQSLSNFKIRVKGYMWSTDNYTNQELTETFAEVNPLIIDKYQNREIFGYQQLVLFLKGNKVVAKLLHKMSSSAGRLYRKLIG